MSLIIVNAATEELSINFSLCPSYGAFAGGMADYGAIAGFRSLAGGDGYNFTSSDTTIG